MGQHLTICGPVVRAAYAEATRGQPTFLDVGLPFPDPHRLSVVIWGSSRARFSDPPEAFYLGKTICVQGEVRLYRGVAEIEVEDPAQITVR